MMKEAREPQRSREEAVIGSMIMPAGAGLGDLYYAHYNLRHLQQGPAQRSVGLGWTPSEDAAMVRASVEVTISNYLDVEAPENEIAPPASEFSVEIETASSASASSVSKSDKTSSTAASSDCQISNKPKFSWAQRYAMSVAANPKRHLYTTLVVCAILTLAAVVGAVVTGQTVEMNLKTWLTRGTLISSRAWQQYIHLNQNNAKKDEVFLNDGRRVDIEDPPSSDIVCSGEWYTSPYMGSTQQLNLMTAWKTRDDSKNALDSEALYQMCVNEEHVLQTLEENDLCYKCPIEGGRQERCIQPYSLVAAARLYLLELSASAWSKDLSPDIYLAPSLSCEDLRAEWTTSVQARFTNDLLDCTNSLLEQYELKESGSNSAECSLPDAHMVASLVDVNFARSGRVEYTSSIYASKHDTASLDDLYKLDKSGAFAQERDALRGVYEVGFQPIHTNADGGFYDRALQSAMAMDVYLTVFACAAAATFIFWHTKSLYLTVFGLLQIILALPISWVLYRFMFRLESFPVPNIGGLFIVFSLGADDIFVMVDKWKSSRNIMPHASTTDVAIVSLPSAISATLMTSITTSVAFFASISSDVAGIQLFGTFCGLLVAVDYILSVLLLSPVLCLYDSMMISGSPSLFVSTLQKKQVVEGNASGNIQKVDEDEEVTVEMQRNLRDQILGNYIDFLYSFRWPVLLVSFSTMIACSFVASAFKPPEKDPFPSAFPKTNPYEAHHKSVGNLVAYQVATASSPQWAVQAVFGVQAIDNGNHFNPHDDGSLVYDEDFDASNNQLYLLDFCDQIKKPTKDYICVLQEFDSWLQLQSQSSNPDDQYIKYCDEGVSIPIDADTFDQCLIAFSELTNSNAISHDDEKVKAIIINTRVESTVLSPPAEQKDDLRQIEEWSVAERSKAPEGANNFFISSFSFWCVDTYNNIITSALKSSVIVVTCAALVILLSSRSLTISLFSAISILYVLVGATASLAGIGWSLGVLESVLFAILVGLGSDFILHFAHAYSMIPGKAIKRVRMKHAILHMGPSVLMSAATTLSTAVIMLFCQIAANEKFATMMIMTMIHSLIGTFVIFSVLCLCFGPAEPTKRFDAIKDKIVSQLHSRKGVQTRSEGDLPKSIEIAIDANVNNRSIFRPKHWMIVLSYLVAAIIIFCISFGAASFVKASQEPQIVESAFAADDPVLIVDGDDGIFGEMMMKFTDAVAKSSMSDEMAPIVLKLFETMEEVTVKLLPMLLGWEKHLMLTMTIDIMEVIAESFNEGDFDFTLMLEMFERTKEFIVRLHTTTAAFMTGIREQEFQEIMFKWESAVVEYLGLFNDCTKDITRAGANITDKSVDIGLLELLQERCHDSMQSSPATATAKGSKLELQDVKDAFTAIEEVVERPLPQPSYPEGERWLCIFSNVAEGQDDCHGLLDLDRGDHSALMLHDDTETYPLSYYSLRPDGNPFDPNYGPGLDSNLFKSDLRVNYYQDVYTHSTYPYRYCKIIDTQQYAKFVNEMEKDWWWTGFFNSATFASKVFRRVTGIHVASGDFAIVPSPCKIGKAIIELDNSTGYLAPDSPPE